jgi:hypothetical protein
VDDAAARAFLIGRELVQAGEGAARPGGGRLLVVEIAVDPVSDPLRAQLGEARVDAAAGLAEVDVGRIAEGQDREADPLQARRILGH